jgi:hypothetical protein
MIAEKAADMIRDMPPLPAAKIKIAAQGMDAALA